MTLKEHREHVLKLSQLNLAKKCGCAQNNISLIENGKNLPKPWNLAPYLKAYKLSEEVFIAMVLETKSVAIALKNQKEQKTQI
jgi:predicted transcriptional regulator